MRLIPRSRSALACVAASLALLALPSLASANPGTGPDLVRRSGQFMFLHADGHDGVAKRQWTLANGSERTPVRAPDDVWIEPGSRVRLEGTMQDGVLVLADSLSAVTELAPAPPTAGLSAAPSTETTAVMQFYFAGQSTGLPTNPDRHDDDRPEVPPGLLPRADLRRHRLPDESLRAQCTLSQSAPTTGECTTTRIYDWADEALALNSLNETQFDHFVYVFPAASACGWSGIAELPGRHAWINGPFTVPVIAHELGHNLGVSHAGGLSCRSSGVLAPMGDACTIDRVTLRAAAVRRSLRRDGQRARAAADEHAAQADAGRASPRAAVATVAASGTYQLSRDGDADRSGAGARACRSPVAATTSSSTGSRSASSMAMQRARPSQAC